ncbi:MAG: leucine-rich repeat domain-containing protein [Prevotella sp.]|nr:leucine-rich repeat domain-containing protein [Prevotella sp.]
MQRKGKQLFAALAFLLPTLTAHAQQWTVIELPGNISELPQLIQDRFGCTWQELAEKQNITHLKLTGQDFASSYDSNGKNALHQLAVKAQVIDLSEVTANPNLAFYTQYFRGIDPHNVIEYLNTRDLDSLRRFIYPKTLHHLGVGLSGCDQLTEVVWPDSIIELSASMFYNCKALQKMDIPTTVRELSRQCFRDCPKLESVTFHAGDMERIGEEAFRSCPLLKRIAIPEGVQYIGPRCFLSCESLTDVSLPSTLTTIDYDAFAQCKALQRIVLPVHLESIGDGAFSTCEKLTDVILNEGLKAIGNNAFNSCTMLNSISIPESVTTIGSSAFRYAALEEFTMPDGVTSLGEYAFSDCAQLRRMHLSRGLTAIPARCFSDCQALEEVNIPQRVKRIEHDAFVRCYMLPSPQLPEGLTHLDDYVFWDTRFEHITLPTTLQIIGKQCFRYSRLRSIDVPQGVTQIGSGAFMNCDSLRTATLHEGLLYLLSEAFRDCKLLQDVALPNSIRVLGEWVFNNNQSKKSYVQPPLINVVPNHICCNCINMTSVTLHDRVTRIDGNAFDSCKKLTHIDLPEGLTEIGSWAFLNCPLTEITIPSTVRYIRDRAFNGGDYSRVVVPEGVENIEDRAFYSQKLRYVDFPSTVALLGSWAFQGDGPACDSIIVRNQLPPRSLGGLYRNALGGALYVPPGSVEAYKKDGGFSGFNNILPLTGYTSPTITVATTCSTDSTWFPVVNNADMTLWSTGYYGDSFLAGHLHVGSNVTWPLNHLRIDYCQPWMGYDWRKKYFTGTLINEGTMSARSMEMNIKVDGYDRWFFFTPVADMPMSTFSCRNPRIPYVVRTFNGAQRAAGNHNDVWQNVADNDILRAGRGYILRYTCEARQTGHESYSFVDNDAIFHIESADPLRSLVLESGDVTIPLEEYRGEFPHNEGWNFVGNPFMAYFDIQHLESDAPILMSENTTFKAYSPLDDDLVLFPLQAFLVQRSAELTAVTFHPEGRQADYNLHREATNSARSLHRAQSRRQRVVYDAVLQRHTEQGDSLQASTRIVVTPRATKAYDRGHDAPFMTMDESTPALYSRTSGLRYSLNELPPTASTVELGMHLAEAGTYTLSITVRGEASPVPHLWLKDKETGSETDLLTDSYTFNVTEPCTLNSRFVLQLSDGITAVSSVAVPQQQPQQLYDLQGRRVAHPAKGLYIKDGKKITHY